MEGTSQPSVLGNMRRAGGLLRYWQLEGCGNGLRGPGTLSRGSPGPGAQHGLGQLVAQLHEAPGPGEGRGDLRAPAWSSLASRLSGELQRS